MAKLGSRPHFTSMQVSVIIYQTNYRVKTEHDLCDDERNEYNIARVGRRVSRGTVRSRDKFYRSRNDIYNLSLCPQEKCENNYTNGNGSFEFPDRFDNRVVFKFFIKDRRSQSACVFIDTDTFLKMRFFDDSTFGRRRCTRESFDDRKHWKPIKSTIPDARIYLLTVLSDTCLTLQWRTAVCPTTAVTLWAEISSKSGLCAGAPLCDVGCTFCCNKLDSIETRTKIMNIHIIKINWTDIFLMSIIFVGAFNLKRRGICLYSYYVIRA